MGLNKTTAIFYTIATKKYVLFNVVECLGLVILKWFVYYKNCIANLINLKVSKIQLSFADFLHFRKYIGTSNAHPKILYHSPVVENPQFY